jgi:hypothetical protein
MEQTGSILYLNNPKLYGNFSWGLFTCPKIEKMEKDRVGKISITHCISAIINVSFCN